MNEAQSLSSIEKAWLQNGKPASSLYSHNEQLVNDERASSETRMEDDFRPSILTPIHEVPTRSRLHTAETDLIHNCCIQQQQQQNTPLKTRLPKAFEEAEAADDTTRDDVSSVVSSLSKDDSLLRPPQLNGPAVSTRATLPPTEVSIPNTTQEQQQQERETPDWLSLQQPPQQQQNNVQRSALQRDTSAPAVLMDPLWKRPAPRVRTVFGTPKGVTRPTLGRNQSCPASPRMDFSIASKQTFSTISSSCGDSIDALFNNSETVDSQSLSPNSQRLLGERKMRLPIHRRSKSTGNNLTLPTLSTRSVSSSSYAGSEGSLARRNKTTLEASRKLSQLTGASDGTACCTIQAEDSFRKRNLVKEELKHLTSMVATPIRKLPLMKRIDPQQNLDLHRTGGCLT